MERKFIRDGRAPIPYDEKTSYTMSAIRSKDTKPELIFRKALQKNKILGYRLHTKKLPGRPDISFSKKKIAIFVNGCFWHRCPFCNPPIPKSHTDFWGEKFKKNIERDKRKITNLEELGWKVFVFWECQINNNVDDCIKQIQNIY